MGKKLAIVGRPERGDEVIKLLEMMGGVAVKAKGFIESYCYYIEDTASKYIFWDYIGPEEIDKYEIFTLEEFLKKYPFKVGDKIPDVWGNPRTVKTMRWDENYKTVMYGFKDSVFVVRGDELADELKVVNDLSYEQSDDVKPGNSKCERTHEDVIFDSIIWHLRNSVNNGKQNLSGGECEDYFREVVKKIMKIK